MDAVKGRGSCRRRERMREKKRQIKLLLSQFTHLKFRQKSAKMPKFPELAPVESERNCAQNTNSKGGRGGGGGGEGGGSPADGLDGLILWEAHLQRHFTVVSQCDSVHFNWLKNGYKSPKNVNFEDHFTDHQEPPATHAKTNAQKEAGTGRGWCTPCLNRIKLRKLQL